MIPGYRIVRALGSGAQGVVYLARSTATGECVAVKLLVVDQFTSPEVRDVLVRELTNTAALHHRNIVGFRDSGIAGTSVFLACEYCPGGSLAEFVAGQPLPVDEAVPIAAQILDALAYAHTTPVPEVRLADGGVRSATGLVHRDVKPGNILVARTSPSVDVKMADFGLAKAFEHAGLSGHTVTGAVGGSLGFMPRSQVVNYKFVGPEVDVWAAAACLYWMLTATTPREFPTGRDPVAVVLREPIVAIRERTGRVPPRLAAVIDEMLGADSPVPAISAHDFKFAVEAAL